MRAAVGIDCRVMSGWPVPPPPERRSKHLRAGRRDPPLWTPLDILGRERVTSAPPKTGDFMDRVDGREGRAEKGAAAKDKKEETRRLLKIRRKVSK